MPSGPAGRKAGRRPVSLSSFSGRRARGAPGERARSTPARSRSLRRRSSRPGPRGARRGRTAAGEREERWQLPTGSRGRCGRVGMSETSRPRGWSRGGNEARVVVRLDRKVLRRVRIAQVPARVGRRRADAPPRGPLRRPRRASFVSGRFVCLPQNAAWPRACQALRAPPTGRRASHLTPGPLRRAPRSHCAVAISSTNCNPPGELRPGIGSGCLTQSSRASRERRRPSAATICRGSLGIKIHDWMSHTISQGIVRVSALKRSHTEGTENTEEQRRD
jgi:hypothetical protein